MSETEVRVGGLRALFVHRHYWRLKTAPNAIFGCPNSERATSSLLVDECSCGAVRTVQTTPGEPPKIFVAMTPEVKP